MSDSWGNGDSLGEESWQSGGQDGVGAGSALAVYENYGSAGWGAGDNSGGAGWGAGDNSGDAGWGAGDDSGSAGWGAADYSGNAGWGAGNNSGSAGWGSADNSGNAGWGAGDTWGSDNASQGGIHDQPVGSAHPLVEEVKNWQRASPQWKESWWKYCEEQCGGVRDPAKHSASSLKYFLADAGPAPQRGRDRPPVDDGPLAGSDHPLVEQVKNWQRASSEWKENWWKYCDEHSGGIRDPAKHSIASLERFLGDAGPAPTPPPQYQPPQRPESDLGPPAGANHALVDEVKKWQRSGPQWKETWQKYCDDHYGGVRDPAKHSVSSLERFLSDAGSTSKPTEHSLDTSWDKPRDSSWNYSTHNSPKQSPNELNELIGAIKKLWREGFRSQWEAFCDSQGSRWYDPARQDEAFLRDFLAHHASDSTVSSKSGSQAQTQGVKRKAPGNDFPESLGMQVKRVCQSSAEVKEVWDMMCDTEGEGVRDPMRHDADFLNSFLAMYGEDPSKAALIDKVKAAQRMSPKCRELWNELCDAKGDGMRDPNKHESDFLQKFLDEVKSLDQGANLLTDMELVEKVKKSQSSNPKTKKAWHSYCETDGNGVRDPARHDASFLKFFLDSLDANGEIPWLVGM